MREGTVSRFQLGLVHVLLGTYCINHIFGCPSLARTLQPLASKLPGGLKHTVSHLQPGPIHSPAGNRSTSMHSQIQSTCMDACLWLAEMHGAQHPCCDWVIHKGPALFGLHH